MSAIYLSVWSSAILISALESLVELEKIALLDWFEPVFTMVLDSFLSSFLPEAI
jgi:hypothetical protein